MTARAKGKNIQPTKTIEELHRRAERPRKAMMMIKAGKPVDMVIARADAVSGKGRCDNRRR